MSSESRLRLEQQAVVEADVAWLTIPEQFARELVAVADGALEFRCVLLANVANALSLYRYGYRVRIELIRGLWFEGRSPHVVKRRVFALGLVGLDYGRNRLAMIMASDDMQESWIESGHAFKLLLQERGHYCLK